MVAVHATGWEQCRMIRSVLQSALVLMVSACSASQSASADSGGPFRITPVATFDSPWAMAFLPGRSTALVTEKPGRIWLVDLENGRKQAIAGVPRVVLSGQGGLLDIKASPTFATDQLFYLTYSEPSQNGGS